PGEAESVQLPGTREWPRYIKALLLSQPLHFGDYGGLMLKIVWALLDILTIIVLGSGLYLWWKKRKQRPEEDLLLQVEEARACMSGSGPSSSACSASPASSSA